MLCVSVILVFTLSLHVSVSKSVIRHFRLWVLWRTIFVGVWAPHFATIFSSDVTLLVISFKRGWSDDFGQCIIPSLQACLSACSSSVVLKVWACFLRALHCGLGIVLLEPVVFCLDRKHTPTPVHPIDRTQAKHVHLIMIKLKFNLKESTDSKQEREERAHLILHTWPRSKCPLCRLTFDSHAESQGLGAWCCRRH